MQTFRLKRSAFILVFRRFSARDGIRIEFVSHVRDDRTFHRLSYGVERGEILKSKGCRAKKAAHLLVIVILELDVVRLLVHQKTRVILMRRVPFIGKLRDGVPVNAPVDGDEKK